MGRKETVGRKGRTGPGRLFFPAIRALFLAALFAGAASFLAPGATAQAANVQLVKVKSDQLISTTSGSLSSGTSVNATSVVFHNASGSTVTSLPAGYEGHTFTVTITNSAYVLRGIEVCNVSGDGSYDVRSDRSWDRDEKRTSYTYTYQNPVPNSVPKIGVIVYVCAAPPKCTISTSMSGGSITPSQTVEYGDDCTVSFYPYYGYEVASVYVDGSYVGYGLDEYTFYSVTGNHSITVYTNYTLVTVSTSITNGTITPSSTSDKGDDFSVDFEPRSGYYVSSIKVNGSTVFTSDGTDWETSEYYYGGTWEFFSVYSNQSIAVTCAAIPTFTVSTSITNGTITPSSTFAVGGDYDVVFTPKDGYYVSAVQVNGKTVFSAGKLDTEAEFYRGGSWSFTDVRANQSVAVTCTELLFEIKTSIDGGTVSGGGMVKPGGSHTVTFAPGEGQVIASLTVDGENAPIGGALFGGSYTLTNVTADHTVALACARSYYKIHVRAFHGTAMAGHYTMRVPYGYDGRVTYCGDFPGAPTALTVDGKDAPVAGNEEEYIFYNVKEDHTVVVRY